MQLPSRLLLAVLALPTLAACATGPAGDARLALQPGVQERSSTRTPDMVQERALSCYHLGGNGCTQAGRAY